MSIVIHQNLDCGASRNVLGIICASETEPLVIGDLASGSRSPHLLASFGAADLVLRPTIQTTKSETELDGMPPGLPNKEGCDMILNEKGERVD